ncbi:MAG TPA: LysR family transcriptional regulator [Albitalea sp.]|uniref:LysR family transcriptional regulator n=1 Tax=Piscinibacter sp. TaxID=1903157 RepID=UPI002ED6B5A4
MASEEPGWELYRTFLGVLNEGSLSGAARALGLAQPTVGRHVAALEKALRLALFIRSPQGFSPTDAALALRPYAEALASTAAALQRVAASQDEGVRGTVRVSVSDVIGVEVMPPLLARLRRDHPGLVVELVLTNRVQDLLRREADIAVRMLRPSQESLVARRVGAIELGLHAHADYLARHGTPRTEADLARHTLIGFDQETAFVRSLRKALGPLRRESFGLRTDSDLAQLAAIRAGVGIGFCQVPLARRDRLVRVMARRFSLRLDTWITMHEDLRDSPRCRATFDALVDALGRHIAAP